MSGFEPYRQYKMSGVDWLGDVPEHWTTGTLRWYATIQGGIAKGKDYQGRDTVSVPYLRVANVQDGFLDLTEVKEISVLESELERYSLQLDDVLMNEGGDNDKLGRGAVWRGQINPCLHQNHVFAIRTNHLLKPEWLATFTGSQPARTYFFLNSKQSTNLASISASNIMSLALPIPPVAEQERVLRFLNHEIARIDALIQEQQRLIELLKEKRQAVISHAVTKGLDPTVPTMDSGVEWLGPVPAHWRQNYKLGAMADERRGGFVNGPFGSDLLSSELTHEGVPVVYIRDVKPTGYFRKSTDCVTKEKARQLSVCRVLPGDVLVAKVGSPPGDACIYPGSEPDGIVTQDVVRIRVKSEVVDAEYLVFLLKSNYARAVVDAVSVESTRKRFSLGDYKQLKLPLPPLAEQVQIARNIGTQFETMDALLSTANEGIFLIQERRSALITAAVTGKIDVRDWQPSAIAPSSQLAQEAV
ncbi:restriction endonuclease subunit S [Halopseudomonas salina]|uniref:Type I restriction-modification protein subunit S n=1 Tax=Halopseudomonas salina TaxID=1323744 RepID=A0ABQ1P692_9GAMM|nr:restriction endonuclease subunit S [Halopseudomonas salina]GGC91848.1 type I restriction-modification protein subunit S [Halopseudomonas salina]